MSTKNYAKIIRERLKQDPALAEAVEEADFNVEIAVQIYSARNEADFTQQELAKQIGTQQSAISRMEDADYGRHSLSMLKRIARALDKRLHIEFRQRIHDEEEEAETLTFVFGDAGWENAKWDNSVVWEPATAILQTQERDG